MCGIFGLLEMIPIHWAHMFPRKKSQQKLGQIQNSKEHDILVISCYPRVNQQFDVDNQSFVDDFPRETYRLIFFK